jgi:hypothetical protein
VTIKYYVLDEEMGLFTIVNDDEDFNTGCYDNEEFYYAVCRDEYRLSNWLSNPFAAVLAGSDEQGMLDSYKQEEEANRLLEEAWKHVSPYESAYPDLTDEEIDEFCIKKYGKKYSNALEAIKNRKAIIENKNDNKTKSKSLSADGDTREGSQNVPDGSDAAFLETISSADTETLDGLTDKDERPGAERAAAKPSRTTPPQNSYGEFGNVKMTTAEFEKMVQAEGADRANALIEELSSYLASSGKRYKSHYATLLNWGRRKDTEKKKVKSFDEEKRERMEAQARSLLTKDQIKFYGL